MDASFLDEASVLGASSPSQLGLEPPNTMIPAAAQDSRILNMALHNVQDRLQQFASSTHGFEQLDFIYDISDRAAVQSRLEAWSAGNFTDMPDMLVVDDAGMKGAMGAYSSERNEIYLGQSLLRSDALTGVLIEEYGHALDKEFNPGGDTVGDEGELLSVFLQSGGNIAEEELTRLRTESDRGEILFNGEIIAVEQATIIGNSGNNSLYGTNSSDSIFGYDGDDSLYGNGGNDTLDGGYGFDYIDGGTGTDTVTYSFYDGGINLDLRSISNNVSFPGNSTRKETVRNVENVIGSSGNDLLIGNSQNNTLLGGNGSDNIYGDRGNDNLIGGAGNDTLDGYGFQSYEKDTLSGGSGGDKFILGTANQTYYTKNGYSDYATILDFNPYEGDTISLQKLSYDTSSSSNAYGYRLWQIGANTEIRVSKTNDLVATLQGITGVSLFNGFRFEGTPAYTDLIVQNQSTPSLAKAGDTIKLTSYVKNIGNATAGSSYLKYYLSDDAILDSGDKYLGLNYVGGLASGSASYEDFTVQLDKGLSGTKYLFFQADAYNWVSESNEFNNVAYKEIKITNPQPDLVIQNQSLPSSAKAGDTIKVTSYVKNIGDATAGYSYLKYYLSDDTNLDSGDKFLGNDYVGSLATGSSSYEDLTFTLDKGLSGTKYILFQADGYGYVSESNESNNVAYKAINIIDPKPDLVVQNQSVPSSAKAGDTIKVTSYVKNIGDATSGSSYLKYYLSDDTTLDSGDKFLDNDYVGSLAAGSSSYEDLTFTLDKGLSGTKYILFQADGYSYVSESNESNNIAYKAINILASQLEPGNTLGTAELKNSASFSRTEKVNANDLHDFYSFTVNQSGVFTADLSNLTGDADIRLIHDTNNNNVIDTGEIIGWQWERGTGSESIRKFLNSGNYFLQVMSYNNQTSDYTVTTNFTAATTDNRQFSIGINWGQGANALSGAMQVAIQEAADFWENVVSHSSFNGNHELTITVGGTNQEWGPSGGVLASAGARQSSFDANGNQKPITGVSNINNNPNAVSALSADINFFRRVMIHEFGHVLGLVGLQNNLVNHTTGMYSANSYAGWAYGELLGTYNPTAIPMTTGVGPGSDYSHWKEEIFDREVMTHAANYAAMPLSQMTIAALRDLGWNVNYGAAESYNLA